MRVIFFADDLSETAQLRRIRSIRAAGHDVSSVSLSKDARLHVAPPDWPDIRLGTIGEEQLGRRLLLLARGLARIWRNRHAIREADLLVGRNMHMAALCLIARRMAGRRIPVLYECLDIHSIFTGTGPKARFARWVERRVLARASLLVVSSPAFVSRYFAPVQGFTGRWRLLENRIWFEQAPAPRPAPAPPDEGPIRLAWVGAIRCRRSLELLLAAADALGPRLELHIHGMIHTHSLGDLEARISARPNVHYHGPYAWPDGLAPIYGAADLAWCQDLWQSAANSDWLLPNRIYEAGWFGCPSLACAATETGRTIEARGLGYTIPEATPEALIALLERLDRRALAARRTTVLALPDDLFRLTEAEIAAVVAEAATPPPQG